MMSIDITLIPTFAFTVIIILGIGAIGAVWATRSMRDWIDTLKSGRTIKLLEEEIESKEREIRLLKEQNKLLRKEFDQTKKLYAELKESYTHLEKQYRATKFLLEENQKANKELNRKHSALESDYEEFKGSISDFMVEAMGADRAAVNKLLRTKKS